jgi:hypothetical protein
MTKPLVRLDIAELDDSDAAAVSELLDDLGVSGEELYRHLGAIDELAQVLVFSTDSLHVVFDGMLAAAGGAAGAKLAALLRRLPARKGKHRLIADRRRGVGFLVDQTSLEDSRAMDAMLRFDLASLADGIVLVWDPETARWKPLPPDSAIFGSPMG